MAFALLPADLVIGALLELWLGDQLTRSALHYASLGAVVIAAGLAGGYANLKRRP